jgi:deoxyadenosine/deoxycytidine kinase
MSVIFDNYRAKQSRTDVYQSLYANMYIVIENEKECYPYLMTKYKEMSIRIPKTHCLSEKIELVRKKLEAKQITKQQYLETIKEIDYLQYTIFYDVLMNTK